MKNDKIIINTIDKNPIRILLLKFKNPAAIVIGATINIEKGFVNPPVKNNNPNS